MTQRKIQNNQDALNYIKKAMSFADIEEFETVEVLELPDILEAYDEIEPLEQDDCNFIISMIMMAVEIKKIRTVAQLN